MEEMIYVNGTLYKLESSMTLTSDQKNNVIQQLSNKSIIQTLAVNLAGATVDIYRSSDLVTKVWTGLTDATGIAKSGGLSPSLVYGDYVINASKYGYVSGTGTFNIPTDASKTIRVTVINQTITITITD